jgi:hypothetical protein
LASSSLVFVHPEAKRPTKKISSNFSIRFLRISLVVLNKRHARLNRDKSASGPPTRSDAD